MTSSAAAFGLGRALLKRGFNSQPQSVTRQSRLLLLSNTNAQHGRALQLRAVPLAATRPFSAANPAAVVDEPLRRRRRRGGPLIPSDSEGGTSHDPSQRLAPSAAATVTSNSAGFAPTDATGAPLDADAYLALASLSPWVPCPDPVVRRALEIAEATSRDVHADLGCGDGRLNFAAVTDPFHVKESWGVDVDENILERCRERVGRRYVPGGFGDVGGDSGSRSSESKSESGLPSEAERLEFVQADLIQVIERQREKYQRQQMSKDDSPLAVDQGNEDASQDGSKEDDITQRLSQSTIVTMYFVNDALTQLKPYLESILGGREHVRVVTVGYEMAGWEAAWAERVLGLTVFKYDMGTVSNDPVEWRIEGEGGEDVDEGIANVTKGKGNESGSPSLEGLDLDMEYDDVDESSALGAYLHQKRAEDLDELDDGLEIHHDERLDDFAQFRSKRKAREAHSGLDNDDDDGEEWDGDWDDTEDPEEAMREEQKRMAEMRATKRGKGMMAGLDAGDLKRGRSASAKTKGTEKARPVWKKP